MGSDPNDRKSTPGFCIYFGGNLVAWGSEKHPYQGLALRLNIATLHLLQLKCYEFVPYYLIYALIYLNPLFCGAIILVQFTSVLILFYTPKPNMWNLIYTMFVTLSIERRFVFNIFLLLKKLFML